MTDRHSPLLFVHGFTGNAEVWIDVISALTNSCSCIALDLPGHGDQTDVRSRDAFTFSGMCTILNNTLDEAEISRANIWGYSMGRIVAPRRANESQAHSRALLPELRIAKNAEAIAER